MNSFWAISPAAGVLLALTELVLLVVAVWFWRRHLKAAERVRLLEQEREVIFGFVHDVGGIFAAPEEIQMDRLLERILFYALRTSRASAGAVYLLQPDGKHLTARVTAGLFPPLAHGSAVDLSGVTSKSQHMEQMVRGERITRGEGLVGLVADLGTPILLADAERDPRVPRFSDPILRVRSILLVPMRFQRQILGVLAVVNRVDARPFAAADQFLLQALADQASIVVHYANVRDMIAEKYRLDADMNAARRIQQALLPQELPPVPGAELAAFNNPALAVGGDYYDFHHLDEDHLGIIVADVSGKGLGGAIMMATCRSVWRAQAPRHRSPRAVLLELARILSPDISEDMFVSVLYLVYNSRTREVNWARAGHERPLVCRASTQQIEVLDSTGSAIGVTVPETFERTLQESSAQLEPGDILVAYTDGITEAINAAQEEWGRERFFEAICRSAPDGAHSVVNTVRQRVERFMAGYPQYDDMTLIALRVLG